MSGTDYGRREPRATLTDVRTNLFHDGAMYPCKLLNISATGVLLTAQVSLEPGSECSMGMHLSRELAALTTLDYLTFHLEVVANEPAASGAPGLRHLRCRIETGEGSTLQDRARLLVYQALGSTDN